MGVCSSKKAYDNDTNIENNKKAKFGVNFTDINVEMIKDNPEEEFRTILVQITLIILKRLFTALDYEKQGFYDLANKLSMKSIIELVSPNEMENVLKNCFNYDDESEMDDIDPNDKLYNVKKFLHLIKLCDDGRVKDDIENTDLASKISSAAITMASNMRNNAKASESSDLKIHLQFFASCLEILPNQYIPPDEFENIIDNLVGANELYD